MAKKTKKGRVRKQIAKEDKVSTRPVSKKRAGQPTKYKKAYCNQIIKYFSQEPTKNVETTYTNKKGEEWSKFELAANPLQFLSNFAHSIGVCHDTILEWCKKHPEFSVAFTRAKELQEQHLIECGLLGLYNSRFAIFTATNITKMRDKLEHRISGEIQLLPPKIA